MAGMMGGKVTPEAIAAHALPALQSSLMPLDTSGQLFSWDPL